MPNILGVTRSTVPRDAPAMKMTHEAHSDVARRAVSFRGLATVYLVFAVLGPWINVGMVRGIRPEEALLPVMAIVYLSGTGFRLRVSRSVRLVLVGLAAIAACISLSLLAGIPRSGGGPVARDTLELVRVAKYAFVMILAGSDAGTARACRKWFIALIVAVIVIISVQVVAPAQWVFRTMSAIDPSSAHFYASQNVAAGLLRATGTFSNPNNCGIFLSASAGLLIGLLSCASTRGKAWLLSCALIAVAAAVVGTQSFTGLIALGLVLLVGGMVMLSRRRYRRRALILFIVVAIAMGTFVGVLGIVGSGVSVVGKRLTTANYALATMAGRITVWTRVALDMADDPSMLVFGMGPQKESETEVVGGDIDSEYVMILKRYGLVGFFCFGLFVVLTVAALRSSTLHETAWAQGWYLGALLMLLAIAVNDVTNVVYANNQLMDIFMFVLGSVLSSDGGVAEPVSEARNALLRRNRPRTSASGFSVTEETTS